MKLVTAKECLSMEWAFINELSRWSTCLGISKFLIRYEIGTASKFSWYRDRQLQWFFCNNILWETPGNQNFCETIEISWYDLAAVLTSSTTWFLSYSYAQLLNKLTAFYFFRLEQNGEYERAAATALFNNQMRLAINILSGKNTRDVKSDNGPREQKPPPGMVFVEFEAEVCSSLASFDALPHLFYRPVLSLS